MKVVQAENCVSNLFRTKYHFYSEIIKKFYCKNASENRTERDEE